MSKRSLISIAFTLLITMAQPIWADSVRTTIDVGSGSIGVAANPRTNKIYIGRSGGISVVDGTTDTVSASISLAGSSNRIVVDVFSNRVYASNCDFSTSQCRIVVIDGNTDTIVAAIPVENGDLAIGIQGLAANPVTHRVYVSDADHMLLDVIDGTTNSIIAQVPVGTQPSGVAVNPKTNRVYVGGGGFPGFVVVYDGATNTEIARLQNSASVEDIATNFRLDRIYATVTSNMVLVIDGGTNQVEATPPTGSFPQGVDVNLLNEKVYVVNSSDSTVTIIDGNTNQVLQTLAIPAVFATQISVNVATGKVYVTDSASTQVTVLQP